MPERIEPGNDKETFRCQNLNNLKLSPHHTKIVSLNAVCVQWTLQIGIADPILVNKHDIETNLKNFFTRHDIVIGRCRF